MKFTTSCASAASNAASSNGSDSPGAISTPTPGLRARHASANVGDGSAAATCSAPEQRSQLGRQRTRTAPDVERTLPAAHTRGGDQRPGGWRL